MAYNSDGYIMIDFTEVDFRRTNQTIEGLYKRCVDVIGTNKFILVINANGRTPLPATCSFTNNQYVIDTVIYMFAVSSNDNLFIRRNDVPVSDIIDDSSISVDKTWSSNKIDNELDGKADASALADYQPLLTAGTNITIDENNVISSTGGAVIDDTVIVNNKVWSSLNTVEMLAPIDTVVGSPAIFKTSLTLPLVACTTSFTATQEGTGNPSPINKRKIVGVDDITLSVNGNDIFIDLDGTRYGGSVYFINDVLVLHVTHYGMTLDGTENINRNTTYHYLAIPCPYNHRVNDSTGCISSHYVFGGTNKPRFSMGNIVSVIWFFPEDDSPYYDNAEAFKSYLAQEYANNTPVQIMYPLAEPFDIQLTPQQIQTVAGNNTIASDTGPVTVSYKALPIDLL